MLILPDLLRARLDHLLPGPAMSRGLAVVAGLDLAVRRGPRGADGLSAALPELVAVGLALGQAAGSARVGWRRSSVCGCPGWTALAVSWRRSASIVLTCSATFCWAGAASSRRGRPASQDALVRATTMRRIAA
ncbi:hypothetical protein [Kitasatospora phosalacinea]|uniref:Uncharacterized protein n=1 Tax=Kitasatospora phosalacinea TaxID=2065 RepID=A0A9W6UR87_9ACTN|nr:hypothetical protein [Kitasatospora phosalacinea]GLW58034.1 hypothetical protein Kpho01_60450 [Kitasatospora phosalacinea]